MKKLIDLKGIAHHEKCTYNENTQRYSCYKNHRTMCKFSAAKLKNAKINHINDIIQSVIYSYNDLKALGLSDKCAMHIILSDEFDRKYQVMTKIGKNSGEEIEV
jgi:hypothetical protein